MLLKATSPGWSDDASVCRAGPRDQTAGLEKRDEGVNEDRDGH
jgi:hypothetical protein